MNIRLTKGAIRAVKGRLFARLMQAPSFSVPTALPEIALSVDTMVSKTLNATTFELLYEFIARWILRVAVSPRPPCLFVEKRPMFGFYANNRYLKQHIPHASCLGLKARSSTPLLPRHISKSAAPIPFWIWPREIKSRYTPISYNDHGNSVQLSVY